MHQEPTAPRATDQRVSLGTWLWCALALAAVVVVPVVAHARSPRARLSGSTRAKRVALRTPPPREVLIRGGVFQMGSTIPAIPVAQAQCRFEDRSRDCAPTTFADEMIVHEVMLDDYWIDTKEVDNRSYRRCVEAGVCIPPAYQAAAHWNARDDHPVTLVSWYDARRFCAWRGGRLPTEAEWERAATGWKGRVYPWGDVFNPKLANHGRFSLNPLDDVDGYAELAPVGSFPDGRTPEGVYDLAGNVEEWVSDWYAPDYGEADAINPTGPEVGDYRVTRGGSYLDARGWIRAAARSKAIPSMKRSWRGFRCVRDVARAAPPKRAKKRRRKSSSKKRKSKRKSGTKRRP